MAIFKTSLVFCFLFISGFGRVKGDVIHNTLDEAALANNLDKFFRTLASPAQLLRRSAGPDTENMNGILARGNFDSVKRPLVTPQEVMKDMNEDLPVSSDQWKNMLAPYTPFLPNIEDFCSCKSFGNCGCCLGFFIKPVSMKNNLCLNVSMSKDPNTGSNMMLRAKIYFDFYKLIDLSVSEKQAPTACLNLPIGSLAACAQIGNFHRDKNENKGCVCASLMLQAHVKTVTHTPYLCACAGSPYSNNQKRGPFGIDISGILGNLQNLNWLDMLKF